ncbi:hypothetical protein [Streptosporangium sp. CA-115845]|uniref:hypothetical protein n=1 Tax=Streptosporangium sp. CA-115845 TaxID=3240071 RepID=UPI003D8BFE34
MIYTYAALDLRRTPEAATANDAILAGPVLGVEVTIPALAARCSLGNIDPQHLGGDATTAAIEAALTWPIPPGGTCLVTVRPDADALGAMAILTLREEAVTGYGDSLIDTAYTLADGRAVQGGPGLLERAKLIADADKEATGPWPGPRPIEGAESLLRETTALEAMCMDHRLPLRDRVLRMRNWLLCGQFTGQDDYRARALAEAETALADLRVQVWGEIATVTGAHRLAMSIGYRHAPVVVATNPAFSFAGGEPHRKHTVARWNSSTLPHLDWAALAAQLNKEDPAATEASGWGGSTSIIGSPQGVASGLSTANITGAVQAAVLLGL